MIIIEDILKSIFEQLPSIKGFKPQFNWGNENALNLFLSQKNNTNKYPLVWLVESEEEHFTNNTTATRDIKLIIAKESAHKTNTNPIIWESEFTEVLNPMLKNVITALEKSGVTSIYNQKYNIQRFTNYTENSKESKAFDQWNVIIVRAKITFQNKCINQIKF